MRLPDQSTPVERCLEMAWYTEHMLGKFPENPRLAALSQRMGAGAKTLEAAELAYALGLHNLVRLRLDVDFEDYRSDRRVRRTRKQVEIHDGRQGGRVASQVFPSGSLDFSRLQGARQIEEMRTLESRVAAAQDIWPEAAAELADLTLHRTRHAAAIEARDAGVRQAKDLRTARNAAKERFIALYTECVNLVAAEFPRDRETQRLFFLDARPRRPRRARPGDGDGLPADPIEDAPEEPIAEPIAKPIE
jgi:hypothetical protein